MSDAKQEAETNTVLLPDDKPFVVRRMLQFCYLIPSFSTQKYPNETDWKSPAHTAAELYAFGEKYGMEKLKEAAKTSFEGFMRTDLGRESKLEGPDDICSLTPLVYEGTPDSDRGLRNPLAEYIQQEWDFLVKTQDLKQVLLKNPEFSFELLLLGRKPIFMAPLYSGECRRCEAEFSWKPSRVTCSCG